MKQAIEPSKPMNEPASQKGSVALADPGEIDAAIARVEGLYTTITGLEVPNAGDGPYAAIPPEKDPRRHVEEQLDRLIDMLDPREAPQWGAPSSQRPDTARALSWLPRVSTAAEPSALVVLADVPGVPRESLDVSITGTTLRISGERASPPLNRAIAGLRECPVGRFERSIELPPDALPDQLEARLRDGVLEIRIGRVDRSPETRPIAVRAS